ncbi:ParB/RepB/Spo0J family partition protein [Bifidobacterium sp. SO1]|uniref:ParB/RepB/Spo0J family partition protein n=1 Tax=Bifidobacterium sp. SO1 TaxID=2809029 RepID=UPI001BDC301C|nr:ParB/RepB/Spo0J family partition protein [Bifidobacterium sp. SO1]MBT1162271.1 ParB/RepB/Spo0J family partition protein [Bifidobacterium sp. SO1]
MAKSRLGKGLGALFPDLPGEPHEQKTDEQSVIAGMPAAAATTGTGAVIAKNDHPVKTTVVVPAKDASTVAAIASAAASMGRNSSGDPLSAVGKTDAATDGGKVKAAKTKRAAMPGIGDIAHPSDLFFGGDHTAQSAVSAVPSAAANVVTPTAAAERPTTQTAAGKQSKNDKDTEEVELKPVQGGYLAELTITDIGPNAHQPRTVFDEDELAELSASIKEVGILQPIVVRKRPASQLAAAHPNADELSRTPYELIMGERRWRASQLAGLTTIPAIVKTTADDDMLRDALLENLHRVALNPLEEAAAYQQMIDEFGLTQAQLSKSVSKSRPQIANTLRLLNLPASVQKKVAAGVLSAGHARALLALGSEDEMEQLAQRIIAEGLSVRSTEEIVAMKVAESDQPRKARANKNNPWANSPIREHLENRFDTKVSIKGSEQHGRIEIVFSSPEDMNRILDLLMPEGTPAPDSDWK